MSRVSPMVVFGGLILTTFATPKVAQYFPQPESPVSHQSQDQEELQIFTGTIVSMGSGILFLKNDVTETSTGWTIKLSPVNLSTKKYQSRGS